MRSPELDPGVLDALEQAQCAAAALLDALPPHLTPGLRVPEIQTVVREYASQRGLDLASAPRVFIGQRLSSGLSPQHLFSRVVPHRGLELSDLVTVDVHPLRTAPDGTRVAGDYARTLRVGDNGRHRYYQRVAQRVYARFVESLDGCRTERDAWHLAAECAHHEGCTLLNPVGQLGHHVAVPHPASPLLAELVGRKEWLEHHLRARMPLGLASLALPGGLWSLEPRIEVDRHHFCFEDLFVFQAGGVRLLGPMVESRGL